MTDPPEDPFARWAHRRDPDLDQLEADAEAPPEPAPPGLPAGASRYGWFVGLLVVLILALITLNTFRSSGLGSGIPVGRRLPPFALPALGLTLNGDANVRTSADGKHPKACDVTVPGSLNFCRLSRGRPLVIAFAAVRDGQTVRQLDVVERVQRRFPGVLFLGIFLKGSRDRARALTAQHGWTFPLGWDRSADVAAVYGVKSLPVLVFGDRQRRSRGAVYPKDGMSEAALAARVRRLEAR